MKRRTIQEQKEYINSELERFNQEYKISHIDRKNIIFTNGVTLVKPERGLYISKITKTSSTYFAEHSDKWLDSDDFHGTCRCLTALSMARGSRNGGVNCQAKHGDKIKDNLNTGTPWNKDQVGVQEAWNKGLTKATDARVASIAADRVGEGNPFFGKKHSQETKDIQSALMKQKILDGEFTPNVKNSRTHWTAEWNGRKYRSTWEAKYHKLYPHLEYEKIRIPYLYEDKQYIYITDFVDEQNKVIYEIKPSTLVNDNKVKAKEEYAIKWCNENNYQYVIVTEKDEPLE